MNEVESDREAYERLFLYTLELRDPEFRHQHVVDAYAVQHAGPETKPIALIFGLIGLYLHVEKGFSGRQVQRAHMQMARKRRRWVAPAVPEKRNPTSGVREVMAASPGADRHAAIDHWCAAVWSEWRHARSQVASLANELLGVADRVD